MSDTPAPPPLVVLVEVEGGPLSNLTPSKTFMWPFTVSVLDEAPNTDQTSDPLVCPHSQEVPLFIFFSPLLFFWAPLSQIQSPWLHLEVFLGNCYLLCFCGNSNQTGPSAPLSSRPKVNMDLSSLLDSEDKKSKNKRGVLPKHATNIMRSWLFQHLMVRPPMGSCQCVTDWSMGLTKNMILRAIFQLAFST